MGTSVATNSPIPQRRPKHYVTVDQQRQNKLARVVLNAIKDEFPNAPYFTIEDALQIAPMMHVATITRYNFVREAFSVLAENGSIYRLSRTQFGYPQKRRNAVSPNTSIKMDYARTVRHIVQRMPDRFSVMDVVAAWNDKDLNLTPNAKRSLARTALRRMATDGAIRHGEAYGFEKLTEGKAR